MAKKPTKSSGKTEERDDSEDLRGGPGKYSRKIAAFWKKSIEGAESLNSKWYDRGDSIIKRFRDDRKKAEYDGQRRLNVLWANFKVLKPALYGRQPIPICERRYLQRDPVARLSSIILERNTRFQIEVNGFHQNIGRAVNDYLLPGRGVVWARYEPEFGQGDSIPVLSENSIEDDINDIEKEFGDTKREDSEETEKLESTGEQLLSEQAPVDYIPWKDFIMLPVRAATWDQVQAIAKRVYISKEEAEERFSKEVAENLRPDTTPLDDKRKNTGDEQGAFHDTNERSIVIYEIWNKTDRRVYWISTGYDYLCDVKDDFLKLKKFFPVPEPISATLTNDSLIPVPDYWEYQDQAIQIDEITQRLALLTKACKVAGTYDASSGPLNRLFEEGFENDLLPVDSWAAFAEKGGVAGGMSFLPIDVIQKVIQTLQQVRQQLMQDLDLITGITDIQRGTTDSRETLGGIRLKSNTTGSRLSERQNEVARFCRDTIAIVAEIAAKHFDEKTLVSASNILLDDDMQPDAIMQELESPSQNQNPFGMQPKPAQPGMPQLNAPQLPGMPPQQPQNNVVQFPPQPPSAMPPGGMPPQVPMGPNNISGMPPNMGAPMMPMMPPPPNPVLIIRERLKKAIELLRSDVPLGYRIDIETDSTIFGDAQQERKDATEFIQACFQFLTTAGTIAQQEPEAMPLMGRMMQWGVRKFRVGRDLESAIDSFVTKMDKKAKQAAKNPQPNPEQIKAQAEMQTAQLQIQSIQMTNKAQEQKIQMEQAAQAQNDQRDLQKQHMEDARQAQLDQMEAVNKQREMSVEASRVEREHQLEIEKMERQNAYDKEAHTRKMEQLKLQAAEKEKSRKEKANKPKKKVA